MATVEGSKGYLFGLLVGTVLAHGITYFDANRDIRFLEQLYQLERNGARVEYTVSKNGTDASGERYDAGLASLVQFAGVDPKSVEGKAMIYEAMCNPENAKNLYGVAPEECKTPSSTFKMPGYKGGPIVFRTLRTPEANQE